MIEEENMTITEEQGLTCFDRHPDAGGQCFEPWTREVHGLIFCEVMALRRSSGRGWRLTTMPITSSRGFGSSTSRYRVMPSSAP